VDEGGKVPQYHMMMMLADEIYHATDDRNALC
jgi:hypothetical protein